MRTHVAGIVIGSRHVFVGLESGPIRSFETITGYLVALSKYLLESQVTTIAMEATDSSYLRITGKLDILWVGTKQSQTTHIQINSSRLPRYARGDMFFFSFTP